MYLSSWQRYSDWGLLALRLTIAAAFLYHGYTKWAFWTDASDGMPANMLMLMRLLSIVEPLGGLALLVGFMTRLASLGLAIIMVGAIFMKITAMGVPFASGTTTGWEFDLALLGGCIALMFIGAGKVSLEGMMKKA